MTRICEKFVEEITSGSGSVSDELKQHLASCSVCREAFESVRQLKDARKPLTGKEAASIAGILKAVQTGAAASSSAVSGSAAGGGSLLLRQAVLVVCVLSIIGVLLLNNRAPEVMPETPANGITTVIEPKTDAAAVSAVDETADLTDNVEAVNAVADEATGENVLASGSLTDDSAQVDVSTGEARTISVSPDQEDIEQR
ncbi:MAG: hypothetical protein CVV42_00020 [Candidatus Riflebacteria bacterium HGW-Riflebacteria-2]|jgi:hypothetical protein|nr:MAG: hypothetical protein CVV42_00020 [Candidatus Riflebacteria bacterium HGW-Riflebacteria-2]